MSIRIAMTYQKVKGTTDYFPDDKALQNRVFGYWHAVAGRYSFEQVEAPALETMSLLTAKSGEEVKSQIFTLDKRSSEELGLRFEFTASVARMFIERQKSLQKPVRWYSLDRVWRYEQPQAGRMREFYQFNAEIFGSAKPESDAEVISLAIDSLRTLGLTSSDFEVRLNNRKLLQGLLADFVAEKDMAAALHAIDRRPKVAEEVFRADFASLDDGQYDDLVRMLSMDFAGLAHRKKNALAEEGYAEVKTVLDYLGEQCARFDMGTARGLVYYTGTVFEIFDSKGKYRALCGGGRYDCMIEAFGGQKTPATGFGMGYSTVSLLLKEKGLQQDRSPGPEYFVAIVKDEVRAEAIAFVRKLRVKHSVSYDLNQRNLANQIKYANALRARRVIFIGPDEIKAGTVKIKDLSTGKEESTKMSFLISS
jgi:histidyl-tRNA synthetase